MVSRRRRKRRKGSSANMIMKKRLGILSWNGSRPFLGWSKTLTTRTLGEGHNPGTTAGAQFSIPVNNWNDPLGSLATLVAGTGSLTSNRHPMDHDSAIASGYQRVQVLSWKAEIDVNWITGASNTGDFVVAYTFNQDVATEVALTAGTAARIEALEIETNRRWTTKRFNSAAGASAGAKRNTKVVINVPNVFAYCDNIARGTEVVEANNATCSHVISDNSFQTDDPEITLFCNVVIYQETGLEMLINSILVKVAITQKVKIMRDKQGAQDMDDGEPDVHA